MTELPERIKRLLVTITPEGRPPQAAETDGHAGELIKESIYSFRYARDGEDQPAVSLLMPASKSQYDDGELFPAMDQNLPEGFLLQRIIELFPKRKLNKVHLLALMGDNGIGRVGYRIAEAPPPVPTPGIDREALLRTPMTPQIFENLVREYLRNGIGLSGVQPKIMLPTRASIAVPNLIVKTAGPAFPGLAANEFLCLTAAAKANIAVPGHELSHDGQLLVIDRFDLTAEGGRLGFEDIAALKGERVNDRLDNRKYIGSYESVAEIVGAFSSSPSQDLQRLFEQLAFSMMVRNGDAHLKNFGMLYSGPGESKVALSPMFDVVTTTIYKYERPGGFEDVDRTMALKLWRGKSSSRAYPTSEELLEFGRKICKVTQPAEIIQRIADAMRDTLVAASNDGRIPSALIASMQAEWEVGMGYTLSSSSTTRRRPKGRR